MTRIIKTTTHQQVYNLRAKHIKNDSYMSGRGQMETDYAMTRIIYTLNKNLKFNQKRLLLDIGPGNGTLLKKMSTRIGYCYGIDPSPYLIKRLMQICKEFNNIKLIKSVSFKIPLEDNLFDYVVINGVISLLSNHKEVKKTLKEIKRLSKKNAVIYIGEVPSNNEIISSNQKIKISFIRKVKNLINNYISSEPIIISPKSHLFYKPNDFLNLCRVYGLIGKYVNHRSLSAKSTKRYDYILRKEASLK